MPTKKPVVQIVISDIYYKKLQTLGKKEDKSNSKIGAKIIERYIDEYEKENGAISLGTNEADLTNPD